MAICKTCNRTDRDVSFYASIATYCKEHWKERVRLNRQKNSEYYKEFDRQRANYPRRIAARKAYAKTAAYKRSHSKSSRRYHAEAPIKKQAHTAISSAIRDGTLKRQPCHVCGAKKVEAHHPDYTKPLDVLWLCKRHHEDQDMQDRIISGPKLHAVTRSGSIAVFGTFAKLPLDQYKQYVRKFPIHWIS